MHEVIPNNCLQYYDVILGNCARVKDGSKVEGERRLEAGEVVLGYQEAVVKPVVKLADSNSVFGKEYKEAIEKDVSFFLIC